MKPKNRDWTIEISLPGTSTADLRGRQSVRATFKLTAKAIDAISVVSTHLGIKQKSLFDHLMQDSSSLDMIASEIQDNSFKIVDRVQKTYVLSRKTLSCLDSAAKKFDAPRDALVEYSIQRLLPIIIREREKHRKRKEILHDLAEYLNHGYQILQKSQNIIGDDDPILEKIKSAVSASESMYNDIKNFIQRCEIIEDF
ncbi:MAG: hypothetical protein JRI61_01450 [Deltaproteobacteria bacterium]|nr:hypothetical protein [Deltaproteobacteria bacterium]